MAAEVRLLHEMLDNAENETEGVGTSLRTAAPAQNTNANSGMSLRTTGLTADNIDPNSSMSLRTTEVTADNRDPNSSSLCGLLK